VPAQIRPQWPFLGAKSRAKIVGWSKKPWNIRNLESTRIYLLLFALSSIQYWIFRRGGRSGDHFHSKKLTFKLSLAIMKRLRNSFEGRGRPFIKEIFSQMGHFYPFEKISKIIRILSKISLSWR
jgi:hypothetical protein